MISGNHWRALYSETRYETMAVCAKEMMIDKKFSPEGAVICLHFLADHISLNPAEIKGDDWLVDIFLHNVENTACWRLLRPYPLFFCWESRWNYTKKSAAIRRKKLWRFSLENSTWLRREAMWDSWQKKWDTDIKQGQQTAGTGMKGRKKKLDESKCFIFTLH